MHVVLSTAFKMIEVVFLDVEQISLFELIFVAHGTMLVEMRANLACSTSAFQP